MDQADLAEYSLSPLQTFFAKVAIVTVAFLIVIYYLFSVATTFSAVQAQRLEALKGGPAFWGAIEKTLYALADAPDIEPEKKKKIVDAVHRLSLKYKPYIDAIGDDVAPDTSGRDEATMSSR
jgi:hypothetical protein